jgi:hypothetical protein
MKILRKLFHRHDWAYALGDSPGVIDNKPRLLCFHRLCTTCLLHEEVSRFSYHIFHTDNRSYSAGAIFMRVVP